MEIKLPCAKLESISESASRILLSVVAAFLKFQWPFWRARGGRRTDARQRPWTNVEPGKATYAQVTKSRSHQQGFALVAVAGRILRQPRFDSG